DRNTQTALTATARESSTFLDAHSGGLDVWSAVGGCPARGERVAQRLLYGFAGAVAFEPRRETMLVRSLAPCSAVVLALFAACVAPTPKVPVVTTVRDISAGATLTAADLKVAQWPEEVAPTARLTAISAAEGRVARVDLFAGEALREARLTPQGAAPDP